MFKIRENENKVGWAFVEIPDHKNPSKKTIFKIINSV